MSKRLLWALTTAVVLAGGLSFWKLALFSPDTWASPPSPGMESMEGTPANAPWIGEPIQPLPMKLHLDPRKVELGKRLFKDPRLSRNNKISCATCHKLDKGGADNLPRSVGIDGQLSDVKSPTVFNAAFNFKHFWDGRANSLEEQAEGPILNPKEMGCTWVEVMAKLNQDASYVSAFKEAYPEGMQPGSIKAAIAAFVRSLVTPSSFDRWLRGDPSAITEEEKRGYELFKEKGCVRCHQGVNVGGNIFSRFGVIGDYFKDRGHVTKPDYGRFNVTGREEDRFVFKVPSLRNVALNAPYFHDGSAATLEEAVRLMGRYQLGKDLPAGEVELIVKFLKTLNRE